MPTGRSGRWTLAVIRITSSACHSRPAGSKPYCHRDRWTAICPSLGHPARFVPAASFPRGSLSPVLLCMNSHVNTISRDNNHHHHKYHPPPRFQNHSRHILSLPSESYHRHHNGVYSHSPGSTPTRQRTVSPPPPIPTAKILTPQGATNTTNITNGPYSP